MGTVSGAAEVDDEDIWKICTTMWEQIEVCSNDKYQKKNKKGRSVGPYAVMRQEESKSSAIRRKKNKKEEVLVLQGRLKVDLL